MKLILISKTWQAEDEILVEVLDWFDLSANRRALLNAADRGWDAPWGIDESLDARFIQGGRATHAWIEGELVDLEETDNVREMLGEDEGPPPDHPRQTVLFEGTPLPGRTVLAPPFSGVLRRPTPKPALAP